MGAYALFVELAARRCVVVGGGVVAERKVDGLLAAGAAVTVVSPTLTPALAALAARGEIAYVARRYARGDLEGATLAFAATDAGDANGEIADEARARGVWVNAADDPAHCTVFLPAVVRRGPVTVAILAIRASLPALGATREYVEATLPEAFGALGDIAADARRALHAAGRRAPAAAWSAALHEALRALVAGDSRDDTARRLRVTLEAACA